MVSLLTSESEADSYYGFPAGTLEALGQSETSNGVNLGSIGNIFQVTPATAANPGYGVASVNGNDPFSVGAYLSALINGPGGGSVANGLALYQGRPVGSTGNNAMSAFLTDLGNGVTPTPLTAANVAAQQKATGVSNAQPGWLTDIENYLSAISGSVLFVVLGILLVLVGLYALAVQQGAAPPPAELARAATAVAE